MAEEYIASSGVVSGVYTKKRSRKSIKTDVKDWSDDVIFSLIDECATKDELFNNRNALYYTTIKMRERKPWILSAGV